VSALSSCVAEPATLTLSALSLAAYLYRALFLSLLYAVPKGCLFVQNFFAQNFLHGVSPPFNRIYLMSKSYKYNFIIDIMNVKGLEKDGEGEAAGNGSCFSRSV
jgi:hypothetical protein